MQKVLIQDQEETPVILGLCQKGHPASTFDVDAGCGATCSGNTIREEFI